MTGISVEAKGNYARTSQFLQKLSKLNIKSQLEKFGREGVAALKAATPIDSSETANSWSYKVVNSKNGYSIEWYNSHSNIAILLQYGHGTGTGGYVKGRDYINPAIKPIFDRLAANVRKAVTSV